MYKKVDKKSWKFFYFKNLFKFERGKRYKKEDHTIGEIPYISSTKFNNGIDSYVNPPEYMKIYNNVLTLNNSGSIGYCFYHPYNFVCSDHCTIINILKKHNQKLNVYIALFLKPIIEKLRVKYDFAREISDSRLKKENILLPVDKNENPDWEFMKNFIKNKANKIIYNNTNIINKTNTKKLLKTKKWKEFCLNSKEVFKLSLGHPIHKIDLEADVNINTNNPYITRTTKNNGIELLINSNRLGKEKISKGNCITIGAEGIKAYYQDTDFFTGNKINILKNDKLNKYNAFFLTSILNFIMKEKFTYGRAAVKERLEKLKIKLPIDSDNNPDWQFMEDYIKSLPYSSNL